MSSSYTEKSGLANANDNEDCITNLHESVLSNILSRLPTKDSVRTSVLSKAWRYKWTYSCNVDIVTQYIAHNLVVLFNSSFLNFINRVVFLSQNLSSFRLVCEHCFELNDISPLVTCISNVLARHRIQSLGIEIHHITTRIYLPCSIVNTTSLRELNLWVLPGGLNLAAKNFAPNLVTLDLFGVNLRNENSEISTVTFNFPLLETFKVAYFRWLNVKSVEINAPLLTTFISQPMDQLEEYDYSIVIVAPRLASFTCSGGGPEEFIIVNGSSVVSAFLLSDDMAEDFQDPMKVGIRVAKLLNGFTNLEELELYDAMGEVFRVGPPLSCHDKLTRLTLSCWSTVKELLEFLHVAPSLKFLSVVVDGFVDDCDYESMERVPSCIASHLEEVKFPVFCCRVLKKYSPMRKVYWDLVSFLLVNGDKLRKLSISCCPSDDDHGCKIAGYVSALAIHYPDLTIDVESK